MRLCLNKTTYTRKPGGGWAIKAQRDNREGDVVLLYRRHHPHPVYAQLGAAIHRGYGAFIFELRGVFEDRGHAEEVYADYLRQQAEQERRQQLRESLRVIPGGLDVDGQAA